MGFWVFEKKKKKNIVYISLTCSNNVIYSCILCVCYTIYLHCFVVTFWVCLMQMQTVHLHRMLLLYVTPIENSTFSFVKYGFICVKWNGWVELVESNAFQLEKLPLRLYDIWRDSFVVLNQVLERKQELLESNLCFFFHVNFMPQLQFCKVLSSNANQINFLLLD